MTSTPSPERLRYFTANGTDIKRAADLPTLAALAEFLNGANMILTCSEVERTRVAGGGHADVLVIKTQEEAVTPVPHLDGAGAEIRWEGFGEVISLTPFLELIVGKQRTSFWFEPHVGPSTLWCRIKFRKR